MSVRLRRLQADYEQVKRGLHNHPAVRIRGVSGAPPDRYQIEFAVRSLTETADGSITERAEHVAEVYLTLAYPRQAPQCRMLTPVFHPNIAPHAICIGDHWAAGESLLNLILRIGEMLAYQSYNTKSPLNGAAARWVDEHEDLVPTDPRDFFPQTLDEPATADASPESAADQCHNCRATGRTLHTCANGHRVCEDCLVTCGRCQKTYCLLCALESCSHCGRLLCAECRAVCPQCQRVFCTEHLEPCAVCGTLGCPDCTIACSKCARNVCLTHVRQCAVCREPLCTDHAQTCSGCQKALCEDHAEACEICGAIACPDCLFTCTQCQAKVCVAHVAQCASCKVVLCPQHTNRCARCGRLFCRAHYDPLTHTCPECRAAPAAQGPGAPPPVAPVAPPAPATPQPTATLTFPCPSCGAKLRVARQHVGRSIKCPRCGATTTAH